ncbi:MAG: prepilin-type N-terminal cleavage/methylation domain-containing protein [Candidatus Sumerlaeia bacterium]|nr:prepilin-type N-terminal cleavage/methylation domain-containing protein [Candidatus Sumerlaeia bacterium]
MTHFMSYRAPNRRKSLFKTSVVGFTLIELLIVVAIIAILALIATVNLRMATDRALKSADAANLHTLATALQGYMMDYGTLPPADREAGPFMSHGHTHPGAGNGRAAGGSWDGVPWLLVEYGYVNDWKTLFTPTYRRLYSGGSTIRGGYARFHNFRYAYNSAALSSGGHWGGAGNIMSGETWILRNLFLGPESGFYGASYPQYPADFSWPFGEGEWEGRLEHVVFADFAVRTVVGGTNKPVQGF